MVPLYASKFARNCNPGKALAAAALQNLAHASDDNQVAIALSRSSVLAALFSELTL